MNAYLSEFTKIMGMKDGIAAVMSRREFVVKYSWAVPNGELIDLMVDHSPIISIGAGTGYIERLAQKEGCEIECYDSIPPGTNVKNHYRHTVQYMEVKRGGPEVLVGRPEVTLFLCWPPYDDPMAFEALRAFEGDTLIYVGEGWGGCTADDGFFEELQENWEFKKEVVIPRWYGIYDRCEVYVRA